MAHSYLYWSYSILYMAQIQINIGSFHCVWQDSIFILMIFKFILISSESKKYFNFLAFLQ